MNNLTNKKNIIIILILFVLICVLATQLMPGSRSEDRSDSGKDKDVVLDETTLQEPAETDDTSAEGEAVQANTEQSQKEKGSQNAKEDQDPDKEDGGMTVGDELIIELEKNQGTDEVN